MIWIGIFPAWCQGSFVGSPQGKFPKSELSQIKFDKHFPQQKSNFLEFCVTDLIILYAPYWNVCLSRERKGSFLPSMELNEKRLGLFPLSVLTLLKDFSWIENQVRSVCDFRRLNNEANISNAVFLKIDTKPHYFLLSKLSDPDVISFLLCL